MKRFAPASLVFFLAFSLSLAPVPVDASKASKSGGTKTVHVKGSTNHHAPKTKAEKTPKTKAPKHQTSSAVSRDEHGRIQRSDAARHPFARQTGYPNGRPGYVIDHIVPLACGGADAPRNMQWQSIAEGKAKASVDS